jgi:hypothetical protein
LLPVVVIVSRLLLKRKLNQRLKVLKLKTSLSKFYFHHHDLINCYRISVSQICPICCRQSGTSFLFHDLLTHFYKSNMTVATSGAGNAYPPPPNSFILNKFMFVIISEVKNRISVIHPLTKYYISPCETGNQLYMSQALIYWFVINFEEKNRITLTSISLSKEYFSHLGVNIALIIYSTYTRENSW